MGSQRVRPDWAANARAHTHTHILSSLYDIERTRRRSQAYLQVGKEIRKAFLQKKPLEMILERIDPHACLILLFWWFGDIHIYIQMGLPKEMTWILITKIIFGNGNPLQYYYLEKSHGQRSLVGYSPWGHKESDMTEQLHFHFLSLESYNCKRSFLLFFYNVVMPIFRLNSLYCPLYIEMFRII